MTEALAAQTGLNAAVALLGSQAAGRFFVEGYQSQKKSAAMLVNLPMVQCYIETDDVNWRLCSEVAPNKHDVTIMVRFTVAQPAKADIATLESEASTEAQKIIALSNLTTPTYEAAQKLYSAYAAVSEILNDARNKWLGLAKHSIEGKRYDNFRQDELQPRGGLAILTATSRLTFRIDQSQLGDLGTDIGQMDSTLQGADIDENVDEISQAGTATTY